MVNISDLKGLQKTGHFHSDDLALKSTAGYCVIQMILNHIVYMMHSICILMFDNEGADYSD